MPTKMFVRRADGSSNVGMTFSRRSTFEERPNRLTALLQAKRAAEAPILDLTESNPTRVGLRYPGHLWAQLADSSAASYQPDPSGILQARRAVAGYYSEAGVSLDPDIIFLTASTSEAYGWLFKMLADPSEQVLIPRPSYPLFEFLAGLESIRVAPYPLRYDGEWRIDLAKLESSITSKTRAIVSVNPNNPTGSFLNETEWRRLSELANRHSMALIVDEVFGDFPLGVPAGSWDGRGRFSAAGRADCLSFVVSGFSKVLGLPQMKLGWIVVQGPEAQRREACRRLELIADTYLSVNTPVQNAARHWLGNRAELQAELLGRVRGNLQRLRSATQGSGCQTLRAEGGWYAVVQIPRTLTEEEWVLSLLDKDDVLVHPGYFFDFEEEAFLVLSLLPEPRVFDTAVNRLVRRVTAEARG